MLERLLGPTAETVAIVIAVFALQTVALAIGLSMELFALSAPLSENPWTIVLAVYSHAGTTHLIANLVGLVIFGYLVERGSVRWRFHGFVLTTGAVAGIAEVLVGSLAGASPLVVGISGAVFALMGYLLASNPITDTALKWLDMDTHIQLLLMILFAIAITWVTRGERVALIAHFTGFLLGLGAGRAHLLRA